MSDQMCVTCKKRRVASAGDQCSRCSYKSHYSFMMSLDDDDQDREFAICPECGSSFDSNGECTNTWCGNSPYQGTDWL